MNKTKVILASIGGVCGVAVLALAYLIWDTMSETDSAIEELDSMQTAIQKFASAKVKPTADAVAAIESNRVAYAEWTEEAMRLACRGDKKFEPTSEAAFKTFMVSEAHRMGEFAGGVEGKLVKSGFPFGFQQYILDGAMPPSADIPKLQRQWDDVTTVVTTLAEAGVYELVSLTIKEGASAVQQPETQQQAGRNNQRRRPQAKKPEAAKSDNEPDVTVIALEFTTRPSGLVAALNSFAVNERFCAVHDLRFARTGDEIVEALGEKKQDSAAPVAAPRGRGRRRGAAALAVETQEPEDEDLAKKGQVVIDPLKASLIKVNMTVKVYDFKTLSAAVATGAQDKED